MSPLLLDVCVVQSPEMLGKHVSAAIGSLQRGDRAGAEKAYRSVLAANPRQASTWVNLAALAVGLGDAEAGRAHAQRVLAVDAGNVDAWINFGVASWHVNRRRDAERALLRALVLSPGLETPALNLLLMWQGVQRYDLATRMLDDALAHNGGSFRLHQARAEIARLSADADGARKHALAALSLILPTLRPEPGPEDGPEPSDDAAQARFLVTMTDACDRLQAAGIGHHLVGGVVVGIVREGQPFPGDKDVDIGIDFETDRDLVATVFQDGYHYMQAPASEGRSWCMGYVHDATGIGLDLFFKQRIDGMLRINLGWPDGLIFDLPDYGVESFPWRGREWPMPAPLDAYLAADYGEDWRLPWREAAGHVFDKRWLDSQISSPSLVEASLPRAINLVLLRLLVALQGQRWPKALAQCSQLLAHGPIAEVEAVRDRLLAAGIG